KVSGSACGGPALRGGRLGLPPGRARLLALEPDQEALAGGADDAAATENGHRRVLQRPAQDGLLRGPHHVGALPSGEVRGLGGGFSHGVSLIDDLRKLLGRGGGWWSLILNLLHTRV